MNPEIRAQWCAALRSGEYEQGKEALYDGEGFCCLGVLCDLAFKAGAIPEPEYDEDEEARLWRYDGRSDYLPDSVKGWAGLAAQNPAVMTPTGREPLATVNDEDGLNFAQIADLIDGGAS
jgi:hypothetical protein